MDSPPKKTFRFPDRPGRRHLRRSSLPSSLPAKGNQLTAKQEVRPKEYEDVNGLRLGQALFPGHREAKVTLPVKIAEEKEVRMVLRPEPERNLNYDGIHKSSASEHIASLERGLDYDAQLAGGGDPTQYSGPGFYYLPQESQIQYSGFPVAIYTSGLHPDTAYTSNRGSKQAMSVDTTRGTDDDGETYYYFNLKAENYPMTCWVQRRSDQGGEEKVIRPHLYNKTELENALQILAAFPFDSFDEGLDFNETEVRLIWSKDQGAYINQTNKESIERGIEPVGTASAEDIHWGRTDTSGADYEKRIGHKIVDEKYGDLEMPFPIYKLLVNVAEFDFQAKGVSNHQINDNLRENAFNQMDSIEKTIGKRGVTTGMSVMPSREELKAIINNAKKANPSWFA